MQITKHSSSSSDDGDMTSISACVRFLPAGGDDGVAAAVFGGSSLTSASSDSSSMTMTESLSVADTALRLAGIQGMERNKEET